MIPNDQKVTQPHVAHMVISFAGLARQVLTKDSVYEEEVHS